MPVNPEDYNSDAISGEKLRALMQDEVYDRLKGDVPESIAVFLCSLKAQVDSIQSYFRKEPWRMRCRFYRCKRSVQGRRR